MSEWIKCSERLPEDGGEYLYIAEDYPNACVNYNVAIFSKQDGWKVEIYDRIYEWGEEPVTVTHWMQLPEPPK